MLSRFRWLAGCFALTIFTSAFLLFQVQPLVSKRILPWFGGSPAVWTTCLLFFQVVLLVGYAYAHIGVAWMRPKLLAAFHMLLIVVAVLSLNVLPNEPSTEDAARDPVWGILWILGGSIGLPYFILSASGPLQQAWFAQAFPGRMPYRLYALSNIGSLAALLSYPVFIEPNWDLPQQARLWSGGFVAFAVLTGLVVVMYIKQPTSAQTPTEAEPTAHRPPWSAYLVWLLWPACAAVALMATTNHVCTDVAAVPFLWVVPLALYLLTYVIAFDHPRWHRPILTATCTLIAVYGSALVSQKGVGWLDLYDCGMSGRCARLIAELAQPEPLSAGDATLPTGPQVHIGFLLYLALNFAAMFGICLLCHGELARRRPNPRYLTWFYLMIAAGGALGGVAVAVVAPQVFRTVVEWKLTMFAATIATISVVLQRCVNYVAGASTSRARDSRSTLASRLAMVALLVPVSFVLLDVVEYLYSPKKGVLLEQRNFFGALTVRERDADDPNQRGLVLLHGVTVHGSQFTRPERRGQPTTYYSTVSGVGRTLNFYRSRSPQGLRIGDVGLGVGTLAAYAGKSDLIRFYEIDPDIVELATDTRWFSYLTDCQARGAQCEIKLGDGRLALEREQSDVEPTHYHVLVLDAFSGDAVPVHLLTAEAFELYATRLTTAEADGEDGALAVNISNRYLDLEPVVRGAAERFGMTPLRIRSPQVLEQSIDGAAWVIVTRNAALLRELAPFVLPDDEPSKPAIVWTDAHSSLFDVLE